MRRTKARVLTINMALLQISEPGEKRVSGPNRIAVGIDLGTTNSLISVNRGTGVEVLPDESGNYLLPSVVTYSSSGQPIVGSEAKARLTTDPKNTISSAKRLLGRSLLEISSTAQFKHYEFDPERGDNTPFFITEGGIKDPTQISADILQALVFQAEHLLKEKLEGAVITVPAYFNDAQRQQTKDAAKLIGLNVLRLLNEPTAAAVAYGLDSEDQGNIIVFDLGGGTFDVSPLSLKKGVFEVLATGGDTALGGDDFDQAIIDWIKSQACFSSLSLSDEAKLVRYANFVKHQLSLIDEVNIEILGWVGTISSEIFARITEKLVSRTILTCRRVLRDATLEIKEIDNIIMVGGSTRMPLIREAVGTFFGKTPLTDIDPDKVVAIGAGIQADVLIGNKSVDDFLLLDITPLSLGIETMGELVEKIIPRNTTIPVAKAQEFTTFKDGQTAMLLHVLQGERELVSDCRSLARFELRDIPAMAAGAAKIKVTFQVDADGLLNVMAEELKTGNKTQIQVKPSYGLDANMIEKMLKASQENAKVDMHARAFREAQVEARQLINAIVSAKSIDGHLLAHEEMENVDASIGNLRALLESGTSAQIRESTEELNRISTVFAERRMDLHVGKALKGESIDEVQ